MTAEATGQASPPQPQDELEPGVLPFTSRLRRAVMVPLRILGALVFPDRFAAASVREGRWAGALLASTLAALFASWVVGQRIDMTMNVLSGPPGMMGGGGGGGGMGMAPEQQSDRELQEEMAKEKRVYQVMTGLKAGLVSPFMSLLLGIALFLGGRYVGGKPNIIRAISASAQSTLPQAVNSVLFAVAAWPYEKLAPGQAAKLATPGAFTAGIVHLDWFGLWSIVVLGFAFAEAAAISRVRSFVTVIVLYALWLALTGAIGGHS